MADKFDVDRFTHLTTDGGRGASWRICKRNRRQAEVAGIDGVPVRAVDVEMMPVICTIDIYISISPKSFLSLPLCLGYPVDGARHTFSRHESKTPLYIANWVLAVILRKSSNFKVSTRLPLTSLCGSKGFSDISTKRTTHRPFFLTICPAALQRKCTTHISCGFALIRWIRRGYAQQVRT